MFRINIAISIIVALFCICILCGCNSTMFNVSIHNEDTTESMQYDAGFEEALMRHKLATH